MPSLKEALKETRTNKFTLPGASAGRRRREARAKKFGFINKFVKDAADKFGENKKGVLSVQVL